MEPLVCLEELPNELLAYIFSFLASRDVVRLRYVSRKIRSISEVPSLWNKFLWPWYDQREERSLTEALKVCGTHVQRLIFPDRVGCVASCLQWHEWYDLAETYPPLWPTFGLYWLYYFEEDGSKQNIFTLAPSTAVNMLRYCCNVTEVTLGIHLSGVEVKEIVEKMKHLKKLEICHKTSISSKPIIAAAGCAKLEKLVLHCLGYLWREQLRLFDWTCVGFQPPNVSVVVHEGGFLFTETCLLTMFEEWPELNSQIPAGHTAFFKLYCGKGNFRAWDIDSVAPVIQLDFGQTASYPLVKASNFGLFGIGKDCLVLTNSTNNGKAIHKASILKSDFFSSTLLFYISILCCNVSSLSFVTDFAAINCELLSDHLKQLSLACPNLEQLNLSGNPRCLESLQGLRSVVGHCHNLQGVNLGGAYGVKIENCLELWKLLSEIKMLSHLRIQICTIESFIDVCSQHNLAQLALKFVRLKQLELLKDDFGQHLQYTDELDRSDESPQSYVVFLSHLPSLVCCYVAIRLLETIYVDIITKCKHLKYLKYFQMKLSCNAQSLSVASNECLQFLDIRLQEGVIDEVFMDSVSAHGKLEIVELTVFSVTEAGITALIENSPKLCLFEIRFFQKCEHKQMIALKDTLKKKFMHRKLFNLDGFKISILLPDLIPLTI